MALTDPVGIKDLRFLCDGMAIYNGANLDCIVLLHGQSIYQHTDLSGWYFVIHIHHGSTPLNWFIIST